MIGRQALVVTAAAEARRKSKADREFKERVDGLLGACRVRLKPYQREGLHEFILPRERKAQGGIIADEMGLGKTYSIAAAIKCNPMGRTLVLVPCALLGQWEVALTDFGLTVVTVNNADTSFPQSGCSQNTRVFLATHSCLVKRQMHAFFCNQWDRIVVDEAHILRNPGALMNTNAMMLTGRVRWALTATPIQNQIEDILSLARFVGAPDPADAADVCANHMMRRTVRGLEHRFVASKLPPLRCKYETVELSTQERCAYDAITHRYRRDAMVCILRQRQACVHVGVAVAGQAKRRASEIGVLQDLVSTKIRWVVQDLNRLTKTTKVLIFCTWTLEIDVIRSTLSKNGYSVLVFDGSLDAGRRQAVLNNFRLPGFNVLILQIACGSVGLNLQHATTVYIMSPGWNPTTEMQAIARTHRQGQTQSVTCTRLVAKDTVEESVMIAQQRKGRLIDQATNDDMVASRLLLTNEDLHFLDGGRGVAETVGEDAVPKQKRKRKAAQALDVLSTLDVSTLDVSTLSTTPAAASTTPAAILTSSATQPSGPSMGSTVPATCSTSSAILTTAAASTARSARVGHTQVLRKKADTALTKSIRLAVLF